MSNKIFIGPTPEILHALRANSLATEYSLCEFVDNSQAADATKVDVRVIYPKSKQPDANGIYLGAKVTFTDDGNGMDKTLLSEALKYGCRTPRKGIGRFGFGLKTAAFSIGRKVRIISQQLNTPAYEVVVDMFGVEDDWEVDGPVQVASPFKDGHGTIIEVTDIDRPLSTENDIIKRLAMIYDLFLQGTDFNKLIIHVNGKFVQPANTMCNPKVTNGYPTYNPPLTLSMTFNDNGVTYNYELEQTIIEYGPKQGVNGRECGLLVYYNGRLLDLSKKTPFDISWLGSIEPHPSNSHLRLAIYLDSSFDRFIHFEHEKCRVGFAQNLIDNLHPQLVTMKAVMHGTYLHNPAYLTHKAARETKKVSKATTIVTPIVAPQKPKSLTTTTPTSTIASMVLPKTCTCPRCGHIF